MLAGAIAVAFRREGRITTRGEEIVPLTIFGCGTRSVADSRNLPSRLGQKRTLVSGRAVRAPESHVLFTIGSTVELEAFRHSDCWLRRRRRAPYCGYDRDR